MSESVLSLVFGEWRRPWDRVAVPYETTTVWWTPVTTGPVPVAQAYRYPDGSYEWILTNPAGNLIGVGVSHGASSDQMVLSDIRKALLSKKLEVNE